MEVRESMGRLKERYSGVPRYYHMGYDDLQETFTYLLEASKRAGAEKLDGSYSLKTGREALTAEAAWRIYILLTRVCEQLKTHQVDTIVPSAGGGKELRIRKATTPEPIPQQLYRQLGIPTEIMRPQRSMAPAKADPKS